MQGRIAGIRNLHKSAPVTFGLAKHALNASVMGATATGKATKWYAGVGNQFGRNIQPGINKAGALAGKTANKVTGAFGVGAALEVGLAMYMGNESFDASVHDSRITEIAKVGTSNAVDAGLFAIPVIGSFVGAANIVSAMLGGPTVGSSVVSAMDSFGRTTDRQQAGTQNVKQSQSSMRATSSQMARLNSTGLSGGTSQLNAGGLGNEAMLMHN